MRSFPRLGRAGRTRLWLPLLVSLASCARRSEGERLARTYCAACHAFPEPALLDKTTWQEGVLPQMALRLGASPSSFTAAVQNPYMKTLGDALSAEDFARIVRYYVDHAPDALPAESLPTRPRLDPDFFVTGPFAEMPSDAVVTLLKADPLHERIFIGDASRKQLVVFGWDRRRLSTYTLDSPPTDLIVDGDRILVLESGILSPNNLARGRLAEYEVGRDDSLRFRSVVVDSLIRPVFAEWFDFDDERVRALLICEYGNDRGRLDLYRHHGSAYQREVIDASPGCIRAEIHDMTGDGAPDIVALFAQGDERIVLFENDGTGHFGGASRTLARFPPVYGSMDFSMHDMDGDGDLDLVYVNGDNFDYSRVLKPYHGIRILENNGKNDFTQRYFFPIYGAARAEVVDFDRDGDLDMLTTSNFPDAGHHPERGIMYFQNVRPFEFEPYAFTVAAANQWNRIATADLDRDGWADAIIGAMSLESIVAHQRGSGGATPAARSDAVLYFQNHMFGGSRATRSGLRQTWHFATGGEH